MFDQTFNKNIARLKTSFSTLVNKFLAIDKSLSWCKKICFAQRKITENFVVVREISSRVLYSIFRVLDKETQEQLSTTTTIPTACCCLQHRCAATEDSAVTSVSQKKVLPLENIIEGKISSFRIY